MPISALLPSSLRRRCDPATLPFATTAELALPKDSATNGETTIAFLGQERALEALRFGVGMKQPGYHMYALGRHGGGRHAVVQAFLQREAEGRPVLWDWCYVHNFEEPHRPRLLRLERGQGARLRDAMARLVEELRAALPAALESEDYRKRRQGLEEELQRKSQAAFGDLSERAQTRGIGLVRTPVGLGLVPIRDGDVIPPDEFHTLSDEEQGRYKKALEELETELHALLRKTPLWEREHREALRKLQQEVTRSAVSHLLDEVRAPFQGMPEVVRYLEAVEKDIVENADDFLAATQSASPEAMLGLLAGGRGEAASFRRYRVNLLVDNSGAKSAPVLYEDNPTHQALVGRAEHQARFGALVTDFHMLKAGALHRANGGYLVLDAHRVLTLGFAWASLKRALHAREVRIESIEQLLSLATTTQLEPEPIPLDVKVVLIGDRYVYYLLSALDPDFADLFKVAVDFDDDLPWDDESARHYATLVATVVARQHLLPVSREAVARLVEQSARAAGDSERLSTHLRDLTDLLDEASHVASRREASAIDRADVEAAIAAQIRRKGRIAERMREEVLRGTILLDTAGAKVGQINGLAVSMLAGFAFGHPSRITARVRLGKGDLVDIEREVELGGPLHSKGVLILQGFLGGRFGVDRPLPVHASLVFEQSYGGVEGDSASSAELYALLSALADAPLRQDLAVTGSVNQLGEVQPIGGVNEKIEGFFDVCAARGLSGTQGVVIPASNVKHLMLRPDVVRVVEEGRFHVYAVRHVDEGIALLTGLPAGERGADGKYPEGSVNARVETRLDALLRRVAELAREQQREPAKE
jgi:lon-related putative ATP-dependent protease